MLRILLIVATLLLVGDVTGLLPEADEVACNDEPSGKQCPPTCPTCPCAWHSMKSAPVEQMTLRAVLVVASAVELPAVRATPGRLSPAPVNRPPIV